MKIYTKTGDKGTTSLYGGDRVPKNHIRIEAYGTIDELNSYIGLISSQEIDDNTKTLLAIIQNDLFTIGTILATPTDKIKLKNGRNRLSIPKLNEDHVTLFEKEMDAINKAIPSLTNFILPKGTTIVSYCHIARCVCRRAERIIVLLSSKEEIPTIILSYLNRLSDYLFVLARKLTFDNNVEETPWLSTKQ